MTQALTTPIQVERAGNLRLLAPTLFFSGLIAASIIYFVLRDRGMNPPALLYLLPAFMVVMNIVTIFILVIAMKPAAITIDRSFVTVEPMSILGFSSGTRDSCSVAEFDAVVCQKIQGNKGVFYRIVLRGKNGRPDVSFSSPDTSDAAGYARSLGAAIHLKVVEHA